MFESAIACDGSQLRYHLDLLNAYRLESRLDDALRIGLRAAELWLEEAAVDYALGFVFFDRGELDDASCRSRRCASPERGSRNLVNEPWILTEPNTWNHTIVADAFAARGLATPKISLMTMSVHLRTNLVASGPFITVFPRSVMTLYASRFSLKALPVDFPARPWPVAVVTLKSRTPSPVVELFIEHLKTVSKLLAGGAGKSRTA